VKFTEGNVEEPQLTSPAEMVIPVGLFKMTGKALAKIMKKDAKASAEEATVIEMDVCLFHCLWTVTTDGLGYKKGFTPFQFTLEKKMGWFSSFKTTSCNQWNVALVRQDRNLKV